MNETTVAEINQQLELLNDNIRNAIIEFTKATQLIPVVYVTEPKVAHIGGVAEQEIMCRVVL